MRRRTNEFWVCKKSAETEQAVWIIELAKDRAKTDQDPEWESKMKRMLQRTREKATDRKLTAVLKGPYQLVQSIDVPTGD